MDVVPGYFMSAVWCDIAV